MPQTNTSLAANATNQGQKLSEEGICEIMNGIREIFQLEEEQAREDVSMEDDEEEAPVDLADQEKRKLKLKALLSTLAQLWWSDSEHMDVAAELLADGSRDRE